MRSGWCIEVRIEFLRGVGRGSGSAVEGVGPELG
jgi:hypothetical protein